MCDRTAPHRQNKADSCTNTCYILTALGIYQPLVDFAGAGATVPLTGFGYSLAKGIEESVANDGWLGAFTGGLTACSAGIAAAIFFGLTMALIKKPTSK